MTLTYPMINRSRRVLWLVTGGDKVGTPAPCEREMFRFQPAASARITP